MLSKRWPKLLVLTLGLVLLYSQYTDADFIVKKYLRNNLFRATTLDFSNRQTANEFPTSTLFNITGMIVGGFEVNSIRVKNEGEMKFSYRIRSEITQSSHLCEHLHLQIMKRNLFTLYSGEMIAMNIQSKVDEWNDDLIIIVSLNHDVGKNKRCDFNLIFETIDLEGKTQRGFWDEELVQNFIST